jgi:hypothetical protein
MKVVFVEGSPFLPAREWDLPTPSASDGGGRQSVLESAPGIPIALVTTVEDREIESICQSGIERNSGGRNHVN